MTLTLSPSQLQIVNEMRDGAVLYDELIWWKIRRRRQSRRVRKLTILSLRRLGLIEEPPAEQARSIIERHGLPDYAKPWVLTAAAEAAAQAQVQVGSTG